MFHSCQKLICSGSYKTKDLIPLDLIGTRIFELKLFGAAYMQNPTKCCRPLQMVLKTSCKPVLKKFLQFTHNIQLNA